MGRCKHRCQRRGTALILPTDDNVKGFHGFGCLYQHIRSRESLQPSARNSPGIEKEFPLALGAGSGVGMRFAWISGAADRTTRFYKGNSMKSIVWLIVAVAAFSSNVAFAAKPPPPPAGCAGVAGTFPSIVFGKTVHKSNGSLSSWDIYVGNSEGTCAIKVYSLAIGAAGGSAHNVSMAFNGSQYRIVWDQAQRASSTAPAYGSVKMVQFKVDVANKSIIDSLPLVPSTLYTETSLNTTAAHVDNVSISPSGSSVVFTRMLTATAQAQLWLLDVFACTSSCTATPAFSGSPYDDVSGAVFGAGSTGTSRIYFTAKKTGQSWGLYLLGKDAGCLPSSLYNCTPRLVASMGEPPYSGDPNNASIPGGRHLYVPRATVLADGRNVVSFSAYTRELLPDNISTGASINGVDIIDVTNCLSSGTGSCLYNSYPEATRLAYNIAGEIYSGGWEVDASTRDVCILTMNRNGVFNVDPDMQALHPFGWQLCADHGLGWAPDGIK